MARRGIQRNGIGQDPDIKDSGERVLEDHLGSGLALSISRKASHGCPPPVSGRHVGSKCREDVSLSIARQRKRSEERRVGKECVSPSRSRGWPEHYKQTRNQQAIQ